MGPLEPAWLAATYRLRLPVETWRCPACGLLASYARTVSPG